MERGYIVIILAALGMLSSCNFKTDGLLVVRGNYFFDKGNYNRALIDYYRLLDSDKGVSSKETYEKYLLYNIGTVYLANGEFRVAIPKLMEAAKCSVVKDRELCFRSNFNLGYIYYQLGEFDKAIEHFISALEVKPQSIAAKRNLEVSLRRLHLNVSSSESFSLSKKRGEKGKGMETAALRLLDYVMSKEESLWLERMGSRSYLEKPDW